MRKWEGFAQSLLNYIVMKGDHTFTMTINKLKAFLTILLVSGYAELARQDMYWERTEDAHRLLQRIHPLLSKS